MVANFFPVLQQTVARFLDTTNQASGSNQSSELPNLTARGNNLVIFFNKSEILALKQVVKERNFPATDALQRLTKAVQKAETNPQSSLSNSEQLLIFQAVQQMKEAQKNPESSILALLQMKKAQRNPEASILALQLLKKVESAALFGRLGYTSSDVIHLSGMAFSFGNLELAEKLLTTFGAYLPKDSQNIIISMAINRKSPTLAKKILKILADDLSADTKKALKNVKA